MQLLFEIPKTDVEILSTLPPGSFTVVSKRNFGGGGAEMVECLMTVTATLAPFVTKILLERIRAKRHVVVKVDGMEVRGLSESRVVELFKLHANSENSDGSE
jgi:hypothetical protein